MHHEVPANQTPKVDDVARRPVSAGPRDLRADPSNSSGGTDHHRRHHRNHRGAGGISYSELCGPERYTDEHDINARERGITINAKLVYPGIHTTIVSFSEFAGSHHVFERPGLDSGKLHVRCAKPPCFTLT
jgi:hypothetical protein